MSNDNNSRGKSAAARLLGQVDKTEKTSKSKIESQPEIEINKKNISKIIKDQGSSVRIADSIRINPIIASSLKYWTTLVDPSKSKPDIVEEALLKLIPEEILIEGYNLAKKQNKI